MYPSDGIVLSTQLSQTTTMYCNTIHTQYDICQTEAFQTMNKSKY